MQTLPTTLQYTPLPWSALRAVSYISLFSHAFLEELSWDRHLQLGSGETL